MTQTIDTSVRPLRQRYPALDGVRGLAAVAVLISHVAFITGRALHDDFLAPILSRGNFGVTLFFLLSGFLLYRPFALHSFGAVRQPDRRRYLWRRVIRIMPALWVAVILNFVFLTPGTVRVSDWFSFIFLIQTYNHHDTFPNLTQMWTLVVELSFYLLLPILAWLVGGPGRSAESTLRRHAAMLGSLALVTAVYDYLVSNQILISNSQSPLWLPNYLDWFAGGMVLAVITSLPPGTRTFAGPIRTLRIWAENRGTCWLLAAVLFGLATLPLGTPRSLAPATYWQWTLQHYLYLGAAFFILMPFVLAPGGRAAATLGSRAGHLFGAISYSIYLWHVGIMLWWQRTLGYRDLHGSFATLLVLTLTSTVVVALVSWFLIERPCLRYEPRRLRTPAAEATSPDATAAMHST